ncbi:bifunctional [glutamate--ammonia ligase]-adenylyl-L-tyrosine phosphorylase/[glutamate--ammonia-ligase] adenylyltransferase [Alteromonas nitratireducens]|uniref:bifunctional [glutamate--ammonia ligase]-adenylyl-L-tyrosine phosphorylase/[glutamate--ammonia-ligase] adenylyltransferase n=1 Tax=Alteromonas nitratireducens TaxID=3390813 RepID=UPI0034A7070A
MPDSASPVRNFHNIMPADDVNNSTDSPHTALLWQRFDEASHGQYRNNAIASVLKTLFARSHFVAEQFIRHPDWVDDLVISRPDVLACTGTFSDLVRDRVGQAENEDELMRQLRLTRHYFMTAIAVQDLQNAQPVTDSLRQVSELADALIVAAYDWLYHNLADRYGYPDGPEGPQPMYILAMGKLGGKELNFSSDIDLIFTYPTKGETSGARKSLENQQFFTKLAQKLINALNRITEEGQVFRVDMRLRPFGESGPLTLHFGALEDYYQEQGRHWERFAMIKARVVNPVQTRYLKQLESILQPFTYRRYLDFTTLDALRDMKQLIAKETRRRRLNNNIKLGTGGIREVEFFAQSFQLIHGGREPVLQERSLLATLRALADLDLVENDVIRVLTEDYLYLRKVEHTLQQAEDAQTQTLPDDGWKLNALVAVMGEDCTDGFFQQLDATMARIHSQFNALIDDPTDAHADDDPLFNACRDAWQLALEKEEFSDAFGPFLSAQDSETVYDVLQSFRQQQRSYRLGQRGEDTLNKLLPELLFVLISQSPDKTPVVLARVLSVVEAVTGRTTYLDLLLENPDVLRQLVRLCERSEWIANEIRRFPLLLDELLTPLYLQQQNTDIAQSRHDYLQELRQSLLRVDEDDTELLMDSWRQFKLCQQLRIAASDISGSLPVACVSDKLTVLAEVLLEHVLHAAWKQMEARFGKPGHLTGDELGFAAIAYGKLGGYELGYGSDLDLVFLHNAPKQSSTTGPKVIESQQFYIKLTQRVLHLLNTKTLFGQLYETDLRLRPSGSAGLLCCHIDGFRRYQQEEAWTWEHQALVRARGVLGDEALLHDFSRVRAEVLGQPRDHDKLRQDVADMRAKMRAHLLKQDDVLVDLKQCEGGITDIEFMTQYWVLANASDHPDIMTYTDNLRILDALSESGIIPTQDAQQLQQAYLQLRDQYHHLTLANHQFAEQTESLTRLRQAVQSQWVAVLGEAGH